MKNGKIYFVFFVLFLFVTTSCDSDNEKDTSGPTITLIEPEKGEEYKAGDADGVHIEFDLADESGIEQYKIDIHDGSGHSHSSTLKADAATIAWSYQKVYDDAKGLKNHHVHIHSEAIPEAAKLGDYHLMIYATDVLGNESFVYTTIKIVDHEVEHDHDE
ncbi:MAG: DUF4625 domain-containing protein [Dysgonamonadaceae bacterium]|jgi:hypothetical protein|nr:DUF4625 domain-containing protein [Dysgonamonadaceae bacterium]